MSQVEFVEQNEFHIKSRRLFGEPETPGMIRFLLKTGVAKNEKQAVIVLTIVIILSITATLFIIHSRINQSGSNLITDANGKTYTVEQYVELVRQGRDPLLSN